MEDLADLDALFHHLVGVEGRDAGLRGAVGLVRQAHFLQGVELNVVGHQHVRPVRDEELGGGHALGEDLLVQLAEELVQVQRHALPNDVDRMGVEHAAGQQVQRSAPVFVDDGVAGIRAALEADDDVGLGAEHVRDLALALVTPVAANNRSNHGETS